MGRVAPAWPKTANLTEYLLTLFGRVQCENDADWTKRCTTREVEGIKAERPTKTRCDVVKDETKILIYTVEDAQIWNRHYSIGKLCLQQHLDQF